MLKFTVNVENTFIFFAVVYTTVQLRHLLINLILWSLDMPAKKNSPKKSSVAANKGLAAAAAKVLKLEKAVAAAKKVAEQAGVKLSKQTVALEKAKDVLQKKEQQSAVTKKKASKKKAL